VSALHFEAAYKTRDVIRVIHHQDQVNMGSFREEVTDLHGVKHLGSRQATLDNRYAERIAQEQKPLFVQKRTLPWGWYFIFLAIKGSVRR
jgi:hypothetical protein